MTACSPKTGCGGDPDVARHGSGLIARGTVLIPLLLHGFFTAAGEARSSLPDWLKIKNEFRVDSAFGVDSGQFQKTEGALSTELDAKISPAWDLTAITRIRGDAFDRLEPGRPSQSTVSPVSRRLYLGDRMELGLREFYTRAYLGPTVLTLGKQQIVWGTADGLRVLDVVNPHDFREFILEDFVDSRIPLWSVKAELPLGSLLDKSETGRFSNTALEFVWIPDKSYNRFPEPGALYEITSPLFVPMAPSGTDIEFLDAERPDRFFADSDAGLRLSSFLGGWDLSLNYLYHYDDTPGFYRSLSLENGTPKVTVTPRYERTHLIGGTMSNAFGDLTVRGEIAGFFGKPYSTANPRDLDGVTRADELDYVLGLDWHGFSETLVSFQLFQSWMPDKDPGLFRDELESNVTLLIRREFLNDLLVAQGMWLQSLNRGDGLLRFEVSYDWTDDFQIRAGMDFFYGHQQGLFGQFDRNDRVTFGLSYFF